MNEIYNEDYRKTITRIEKIPNLIIAGPPDADELDMKADSEDYFNFIKDFCNNMTKVSDTVCVIITDRKSNGIIPKHSNIIQHFKENGYRVLAHKIWLKSLSINLFRLTYSHIMIFTRVKPKQNKVKEYMPDVWESKYENHRGFKNGFPIEFISRIINTFTNEGDLVYDPFMGTGSTALACLKNKRKYIGSELSKQIYDISMERLSNDT